MTSISQLEKLYDKLTARERFALIHAASLRNDDATRTALINASPRLRWAMPDYYGLAEGFEFISTWYMMDQLGFMASMYWLMDNADGEGRKGRTFTFIHEGEEVTIDLDTQLNDVMKRILAKHLAWRRLCKEYNVDADSMLEHYPHFETLQLILLIIDGAAGMVGEDALPAEAQILKELDNMRAVIEQETRKWQ